MKKFLFLFLFAISFAAIFPQSVLAHVLKADGSIGAVIHIDPEDDPIVGQPATFFFEFKDRDSKFNLNSCDCNITVLDRGNQINTASLVSPSYVFVFPKKSLYTVIVSGKPKSGSDFQSFTLSYDIRVDKTLDTTTAPKASSHTVHYIIFGAGFVAAIVGFFVQRKRDLQKKAASKPVVLKSFLAVLALTGLLFHHTGVLSDPCHTGHVAQQSNYHVCCNPPVSTIVLNSHHYIAFVSYVIELRADQYLTERFTTVIFNKSPPLEWIS